MKILEAMAIYASDLKVFHRLIYQKNIVESDCLEVVKLLNDESIDISKVTFFVDETNAVGNEMRIIISFSHIVRHNQNAFAHLVTRKFF